MTNDAPLAIHRARVLPEWIDYNGHMNVAYYVLAFDQATDAFFDHLDIGLAYKERTSFSTFSLELHVTYDREVQEGDPLAFRTWLLDYDHKRVHYYHEMLHAEEGYVAATLETISMHIDMSVRRSAPFPDDVLARLEDLHAAHRAAPPPPERIGRTSGIRRRAPDAA